MSQKRAWTLVCCHILFTNKVHLYLAQRILTYLETLLMGKVQTLDRNRKFWKKLGWFTHTGCSCSKHLFLCQLTQNMKSWFDRNSTFIVFYTFLLRKSKYSPTQLEDAARKTKFWEFLSNQDVFFGIIDENRSTSTNGNLKGYT